MSPFFAGEAGEKMFENDTKIPTDAEKTALDSYLKSHFPRDRKKNLTWHHFARNFPTRCLLLISSDITVVHFESEKCPKYLYWANQALQFQEF